MDHPWALTLLELLQARQQCRRRRGLNTTSLHHTANPSGHMTMTTVTVTVWSPVIPMTSCKIAGVLWHSQQGPLDLQRDQPEQSQGQLSRPAKMLRPVSSHDSGQQFRNQITLARLRVGQWARHGSAA